MALKLRTLETPRLTLVAATTELVEADLLGGVGLEQALGAAVPSNWPPELYEKSAMEFSLKQLQDPAEQGWSFWYLLSKDAGSDNHEMKYKHGHSHELCGLCGFKGRPDGQGAVEIGYSILVQYRNSGLATEASKALIGWAFNYLVVREVCAETLPHLVQSIRVMKKNGLSYTGAGSEHGVVRYAVQRPDR